MIITTVAIISYLTNSYLFTKLKDYSVITAAIIEEFLKTYGGYVLGQILLVHIVFGVVEGFIDIRNNGKMGVLPAIFSLLGHAAFGYITVTVYNLTGNITYGLLSGVFSHVIYNTLVVGVVNNLNNQS